VINDGNREVANLFRILQRHYVAFVDMLRYQLTTRVEFERLIATNPDTLTDLERAARFLYLQRTSFGGKVTGPNFGVSIGRASRFDVTKVVPMLEEVHTRLARVTIECLPYADFITRYDRPATLFYLDPPYWGSEGDYGATLFSRADFEVLADLLAGIEGKFILSINDTPGVRETFANFAMEEVSTHYSVSGGSGSAARELIIYGP
jgi:DNA adenine methylase